MALKEDLISFLSAKLRKEDAEKEMELRKPNVMEQFASFVRGGGGKVNIKTEWWEGHATYVAPGINTTVDVDKLRELVDDDVWEEITVPAVDTKRFEAAVELGIISADIVRSVTIEKPRAGFPKFTGHPIEQPPIEVERSTTTPKPKRVVGRRMVER